MKKEENNIFDLNGKFIINHENCHLIDVILVILSSVGINSINDLHLELFKFDITITLPELQQTIEYMVNENIISVNY